MTHLQGSTKNVLLPILFVVAVILLTGAYVSTAQAAPLFEEPVNYEISKFDDLGEEDWGGQVLDSVVADFNNDGFPDIAGTYQDGSTISADHDTSAGIEGTVILINDGDGTFTITDYIPYGDTPTIVGSEDFDNDGDADLVTLNGGTDFTILLNDGSGNFTFSRVETSYGPEEIAIADFDNDGYVDLAFTVLEISPENGIQNEPGIQIFLNDGSGGFELESSIPTYTPGYTGIADLVAADFDDDGDVDIVAGSENGIAIYSVMINDGNAVFEPTEITLYTEESGNAPQFYEMTAVDFDDDGDVDVIATIDGSQLISLLALVNDGAGSFTPGQTFYIGNPGPVVVSDFDNDTDLDIFTTYDGANEGYFLINDGEGSFAIEEPITISYMYPITSSNSDDLNNDDKDDIIISSSGGLGILVMLQTASENPTPVEQATALVNDVIVLDLPNNLENSYLANLYKVEGFIQNGQITPAINQLNAFVGKVNQDYSQGAITEQERDDFVAAAQQLIDDLTS